MPQFIDIAAERTTAATNLLLAIVAVIWEFDHNGVFHLVQVVGVLVLNYGLRAAFLAKQ